jgi:hypothetical protein
MRFSIAILIWTICCLSPWLGASAADEDVKSFSYESVMGQVGTSAETTEPSSAQTSRGGLTILMADSGNNISEMDLTLYSAVEKFGAAGLKIGEVVRFSAPSTEWVLKSLQIVGWSGYNRSSGLFPADRNFLIEVRDIYGELLYKFADTQNYYFMSTGGPVIYKMDIPPLQVPKDFVVVFYDRGSMFLCAERGNATGNSYLIINGQLMPAETLIAETNETVKINWLIRAIGE